MYKLFIFFVAVKFLAAGPFARGADTNAPTATASCFDGRSIGVCFSEVVDAASATNLANYRVLLLNNRAEYTNQSEYVVTSAELRPDRQSVLLQLNKAYPGILFTLMITNVRDLAGNSRLMAPGTRVHNLGTSEVKAAGAIPATRREAGS